MKAESKEEKKAEKTVGRKRDRKKSCILSLVNTVVIQNLVCSSVKLM